MTDLAARYGDLMAAIPEMAERDILCVTTNNVLTARGDLVMGAGIAKAAADRFPGLPAAAGAAVKRHMDKHGVYNLIVLQPGTLPGQTVCIGLFQVKYHWALEADIRLICDSARDLREALNTGRYGQAHLPFPGVKNGRLSRPRVVKAITPILSGSPVTLWELEKPGR